MAAPKRVPQEGSPDDVLFYLDQVVARLERLGDRLESYVATGDVPVAEPEGNPDDHPS